MDKKILQLVLTISLSLLFACNTGKQETQSHSEPTSTFSLDELQKRTFNWFWEIADSNNYQILDRYPSRTFSSIAATGFGLSSYLVGVERQFITREQAAERVVNTLKVLYELPQGSASTGVSGHKGLFYHFLTLDKAERYKEVELSTIDTGLLMAGVLSVMSYFDQDDPVEAEIRRLSDLLYRRVEWDWALNETNRLSMGWRPERGYIPADWRGFNEAMVLLVMAIGSPTHPIPANTWEKWCETYEWDTFKGQEHLNFSPLFGHQYSHMYIDFRGIQDPYMKEKGIDYFENARRATYANRQYCIDNPQGFTGYGPNQWGLTASDGPRGEPRKAMFNNKEVQFRMYWARGASSRHINDDGTIAPTAAGGSVPFAPEICIPTLKHMWDEHYDKLVGEYGFKDAFNLSYTFSEGNEEGWFDYDYLGIDQGPILLQIENHRSGLIWEMMKKNPYIQEGLKKAGFSGGWLDQLDK